jgi:hypothetical protein
MQNYASFFTNCCVSSQAGGSLYMGEKLVEDSIQNIRKKRQLVSIFQHFLAALSPFATLESSCNISVKIN